MDLTQAEAVMDIISAKSRASLMLASRQLDGATGRRIRDIRGKVISLLAEIGAYVDFPEEDMTDLNRDGLIKDINENIVLCNRLADSFEASSAIKEGIPTVIAGKPNVGKSMLMNLLSGFERSIVTEYAGTTRDVIEDTVRVGDILLRLSDTAGLRETNDPVESIGVLLAKKRMEQSRLILAVFDGLKKLEDEDLRLINTVNQANFEGTKAIAIINKVDLPLKLDDEDFDKISQAFTYIVKMSAKTGEGSDMLKEAIIKSTPISGEWEIALNARHREAILRAKSHLEQASVGLTSGMPLDMSASDLSLAAEALGEITGETVNEDVVAEIFSRFCIGK
jgi:tRNA modification GTPase